MKMKNEFEKVEGWKGGKVEKWKSGRGILG
jgi:hypothetical protein